MRKLAGFLALLGCIGSLASCVPAKIVSAEGPRVTYAWNANETKIAKVYELAIYYCNSWNAPPRLVQDQVDGAMHTTTFACVPRPTLPLNQVF